MEIIDNCIVDTSLVDSVVRLCSDILLKGLEGELPDLSAKDWDRMLALASEHGILSPITQKFTKIKVDDEQLRMVMMDWYCTAIGSQQTYYQILEVMRQLSNLMAAEGLDIMFFKGAMLAQMYPCPEWRVFNDIDFYLFGNSERGNEIMLAHGLENTKCPHHHTMAVMNSILLENHYDFVERVNHRNDIIVDDELKALSRKEGKTKKLAFLHDSVDNAYEMTPTMNAIFLIRHMSAHFASETISLRMLYDWALFLKLYSKDVEWSHTIKIYEQSYLLLFVGIIQQILRSYMDYECHDCPLKYGNQKDAEKVWNSIIYHPRQNPYKTNTIKYHIFEASVFFSNRWKHKIAYPKESFFMLFLHHLYGGIKVLIFKQRL